MLIPFEERGKWRKDIILFTIVGLVSTTPPGIKRLILLRIEPQLLNLELTLHKS